MTPLTSVLVIVAVLWVLLALAVGLLCFILFLTEGAMLDWSVLFLTDERGMSSAAGGLGYALFCISMTLGRLCGYKLINEFGRFRMLLGGSLCASAGLLLAIAIDLPAGDAAKLSAAGLWRRQPGAADVQRRVRPAG
ncbi:hypothetical protein D8L93_09835 [Sodalis-like symbiont of Bactericera trigonica]|nr:hypothetical protein D8L93_09835 [Sodalis-like symbiont of Bactericera trigonica]